MIGRTLVLIFGFLIFVSKCLNLVQKNNLELEVEKLFEEIKSCNKEDKECLEKEEKSIS